MKPTLQVAEAADYLFAFEVKKKAIGPHIEVRWGWDEAFQLQIHAQRWSEKPWFVILLADSAIGTLSIHRTDEYIQFGEFYLLPDFQKKGIGSHILKEVLAEADAASMPVKLEYLKWNPVGTLYKRHGFEIVSENDIHYFLVREPKKNHHFQR